ncbi:cysteine rich repeat-containing protein [Hoeflea sp. WL0058]|uniref:Cysteine rich repeat-containing protein n=1 Tax=Flavimaribacter sediminis TaxID=2865987 RepID=A0AAE2ZJM1_9HYPH|nr:cysteine rich repeat-containing protein [Flavimaribacter sediminis]MBW8636256.1 cysteine rich repeat-containing protein [Flavimaribacter sediminis]
MNYVKTPLLVLSFALLFAGQATAQNLTPEQRKMARAMMKTCQPDYTRLCSGVESGGGRVLACMETNLDALSPDCRESVQSIQAKRQGGSD